VSLPKPALQWVDGRQPFKQRVNVVRCPAKALHDVILRTAIKARWSIMLQMFLFWLIFRSEDPPPESRAMCHRLELTPPWHVGFAQACFLAHVGFC
jgi:hypothetical protein